MILLVPPSCSRKASYPGEGKNGLLSQMQYLSKNSSSNHLGIWFDMAVLHENWFGVIFYDRFPNVRPCHHFWHQPNHHGPRLSATMFIGFVPGAVGPSTTGHGNFLNTGEAIRILATLGGNEWKCDALRGNQTWRSLCVASWQRIKVRNCCSMFSFHKGRQLLQRKADTKSRSVVTYRKMAPERTKLLFDVTTPFWKHPCLKAASSSSFPSDCGDSCFAAQPNNRFYNMFKTFNITKAVVKHHQPLQYLQNV